MQRGVEDFMNSKEVANSLLREFGITEEDLHKLPEVNQAINDFFDAVDLCGATCLASCGFTCDISCGYTVSGS